MVKYFAVYKSDFLAKIANNKHMHTDLLIP